MKGQILKQANGPEIEKRRMTARNKLHENCRESLQAPRCDRMLEMFLLSVPSEVQKAD